MTPTLTVLNECKELFQKARGSVVEAMPLLYKIASENLWEEKYSSFGEFCDDCGISRSQAGRLVKVYSSYIIEGGLKPREIRAVDADKLYLALGLPGSTESRLNKASTLSRNELREELAVKENGEEHDHDYHLYCSICWQRR